MLPLCLEEVCEAIEWYNNPNFTNVTLIYFQQKLVCWLMYLDQQFTNRDMLFCVLSKYVTQLHIPKLLSFTCTDLPLSVLSQYVNSFNTHGNFFYSAFSEYYITLTVPWDSIFPSAIALLCSSAGMQICQGLSLDSGY